MPVIRRNHLFLVLCAMSFGTGVLADDRPQPPRPGSGEGSEGTHRKPPEAAFTACAELEEDDVCEVAIPEQKTIQGQCVRARDEARLICLPNHPAAPPVEARAACRDKNAGAACSVTTPDGQTLPDGVCTEGPQREMHCRPGKPPAAP